MKYNIKERNFERVYNIYSMQRRSIELKTNHRHSHNYALIRKSISVNEEEDRTRKVDDSHDDADDDDDDDDDDGMTAVTVLSGKSARSSVRFAEPTTSAEYDILSRQEITAEEKLHAWYTARELHTIQHACGRLRQRYQMNFTDFSHDVLRGNSIRGAEVVNGTRMQRAQHAVFTAQREATSHTSTHNTMEIADQYYHVTKPCQKQAYERARSDAHIAQKMYRLMEEESGRDEDEKRRGGLTESITKLLEKRRKKPKRSSNPPPACDEDDALKRGEETPSQRTRKSRFGQFLSFMKNPNHIVV